MSGRVLVVTYLFPPLGGVGVQRTLKYVTYLPRWGWTPVVVTPRNPAYVVTDPSLLASVAPDLKVHRTASLEPAKLPNMAARLLLGRGGSRGSAAMDLTTLGARSNPILRALRLLSSGWIRLWDALLFPDGTLAWVPFAVKAGKDVQRRDPADVIYSSSSPISAHIAAGLIQQATHVPWVADFRDPWIGNPFVPPMRGPRGWMQRRVERWIVRRAAAVVVAVDEMRAQFASRYPSMAHKFVYVPNGYDRADLAGIEPLAKTETPGFHLLYAGSLYRPDELTSFLTGVELLLAGRPDLRSRLKVDFLGRVNAANTRTAAEFDRPGRLAGVVSFEGMVPRRQALARMMGADALLQLMPSIPGAEIFVGGKLGEYMAFDRPILAVMPAGEGRRQVEALATGIVADPEPASVASALERLLDHPPSPAPADPAGRFDRVNLARELAGVLDRVTGR